MAVFGHKGKRLPELKLSFKGKRIISSFSVVLFLILVCFPTNIWCKISVLSSDEREDSTSASIEEDLDMEMYMDDEVRFVTEDDFLYEEEKSHNRGFHQGASSRVLSHQYERCPPLPSDPSAVVSSGLCDAKRCQRDADCSKDGSVICCYNGCLYACLPKVNPPLAFDWVEETDFKFRDGGSDPLSLVHSRMGMPARPSPRELHAEISPETVSLPGGCYLNNKQYRDLTLFKQFDHVTACSCTQGEVFCEINHQPLDIKGF